MAILYDHVAAHHLTAFNSEAARRFPKWKSAVTVDDLAEMKESHFLQVIEAISVIGGNVKTDLEARLRFRNSCGHPNSFQIGEAMAAAHIESLILNVYSRL